MRKLFLVILLFASLLILSSCSGGFHPGYHAADVVKEYHLGTEGIQLSFLDQSPPQLVYEGSGFDVQVALKNKGAFDVVYPYSVDLELVFDSVDIDEETTSVPNWKNNYIDWQNEFIQLAGRSYYNPEGEEQYYSLEHFKAKPLQGNFEQNTVDFYATICYPYETHFSDDVCVDTETSERSLRKQVCRAKDMSYSKGQGAPVAVTGVKTDMIPRGVYVVPHFLITIEQEGKGFVSDETLVEYSGGTLGCGEINSSNVNKLQMIAWLGNDTLDCSPDPVFFKDGKAEIECILPDNKYLLSTTNFMTSLSVALSYSYTETFQDTVTIKRSTVSGMEPIDVHSENDCYPWEHFDATSKKCITRCDYCANGGTGPDCTLTEKVGSSQKEFTTSHSCSYLDKTSCLEAGEYCILEKGFCPTGTYCGVPQCIFRPSSDAAPQVRVEQGLLNKGLTWWCVDPDDQIDLQRTCGCQDESSYVFSKDKSPNCKKLVGYTNVTGTYVTFSKQTEFTIAPEIINTLSPDINSVCLKVEDTQGSTTYYPLTFTKTS